MSTRAAEILALRALRGLPRGLPKEQQALRAVQAVIREVSPTIVRHIEHELSKDSARRSAEPTTALGEGALVIGGISPRAHDYVVERPGVATQQLVLVEPSFIRQQADEVPRRKLTLRCIRKSERFTEKGLVVQHHDLLVCLVGAPAVKVADDDLAGRTVVSNVVGIVRLQRTRRHAQVKALGDYLSTTLKELVNNARLGGGLRITLKDLRELRVPARLV